MSNGFTLGRLRFDAGKLSPLIHRHFRAEARFMHGVRTVLAAPNPGGTMGRIQKLGGIASPLAAIQGRPSPADLVPVLRVPTEPVISLDGFFVPGVHSKPLSDEDPHIAPALVPLRDQLMGMVGRPVNIQATRDIVMFLRGDLLGQPYLTLIEKAVA